MQAESPSERHARGLADMGSFIENVIGTTSLDASDVADAIFFAATRPRSQMIDLIRVRGRV